MQQENNMHYRLIRWTPLCGHFNRLKYRRLMAEMSVRWVSQEWLRKRSGLSAMELHAFLGVLRNARMLQRARSNQVRAASPPKTKVESCQPAPATQFIQQPVSTLQRLQGWAIRPLGVGRAGLRLSALLNWLKTPQHIQSASSSNAGTPAKMMYSPFVAASTAELNSMHRALVALLVRHAAKGSWLRHLSVVENTLRREGPQGVERLPRPVLVLGLAQLNLLATRAPAEHALPLADLASRLAAAGNVTGLKTSTPKTKKGLHKCVRPDFDVDCFPEVTEGEMSEFLLEQRLWLPMQAAEKHSPVLS